ncbi:NADH:ubiquinone reductase (Na(+)-transporting) subunit C [Pelagibacterium montanilacus]|uniref:NADH:ubiquinone reductase (Na(+)-transporting) subunit C n=1 Tax=Pelagibacterium montanilacus TaxID=2185280 RepID=UPI000F8EB354|nr:NADH:ubiquinone reductase (Na(+)-transporting) subunit C [Pelagibacterium montanilacus]
MAEINPLVLWRRILALPNESRIKTLVIAFAVSAVCALVVSAASVLLSPLQEANRAAAQEARMQAMLETMPGIADLIAGLGGDGLETVIVDLRTGEPADIDPATFDEAAVRADPETNTAIPGPQDIAGLGQRPDLLPVHLVREGETLRLVILPVSVVGYQSTIRAHLALQGDLNTVAAFSVIEQGETPGLGARIEEPAWEALWPGKQIADDDGEIRLTVVRGRATDAYEIDGITGATRTGNAVAAAVQFWMGPYGFGPYLETLRGEGI